MPADVDNSTNEQDSRESVPVRIEKGDTVNTGLTFNLQPGAIVAHPGSAVVFVCG